MDEYYGNNDWRDYLALQHHGILGQKWGHRNGPPYPLGGSDHSASEKKAGWRKSLSGGSGDSVKTKKISKASKPSSARARRNERDDKAFEEYNRKEAEIEKGYKRGQLLSEKDLQRENDAEDAFRKAIQDSKDLYKKERTEEKAERKEALKEKAKKAYVTGLTTVAKANEKGRDINKSINNSWQEYIDNEAASANKILKSETMKYAKSKGIKKAYHGVKKLNAMGNSYSASERVRRKYNEDKQSYRRIQDLEEQIQKNNARIKPDSHSLVRAKAMADNVLLRDEIKQLESSISDKNLDEFRKKRIV